MRRLIVVICLLAGVVACSAPPDKERHQAEGAIAAARAADADRYAPRPLALAESALAGYDAAVAQRDYREALRLAIEARDTAFQAARDASDEKAAVRSHAEQLMTEAATLLDTLETRPASRTAGRMTPGAEVSPSSQVGHARTAMQEAGLKLETFDYASAVALLEPLVARLRSEIAGSPLRSAPTSR